MRSPQAHIPSIVSNLTVWERTIYWLVKGKNMGWIDAYLGGTDRWRGWVFVCWGTLVSVQRQGARRTYLVLFSCFVMSVSLAPTCVEMVSVSSHDGPGRHSVPACVCMSGSDHHSKLYTIHHHLCRSWFIVTILIMLLFIIFLVFFPSKWVSCTGLFFHFRLFLMTWRWGGINQHTYREQNQDKKKWFEQVFLLKCEATDSFWHQSWLLLLTLFLTDKSLTSPVLVVFRLVSPNYFKPKLESSSRL